MSDNTTVMVIDGKQAWLGTVVDRAENGNFLVKKRWWSKVYEINPGDATVVPSYIDNIVDRTETYGFESVFKPFR